MRGWIFLGKVWLLTAAIRVALWVLPFAEVQRLTRRLGKHRRARSAVRKRRLETLVWAVRRVTRFVPRASCLTQALAMQVLLARAGYLPRLRLGLAHDPGGKLHAHAWVESSGDVVIGGGELDRFSPLPNMEQT